jgi:hypothetical protein
MGMVDILEAIAGVDQHQPVSIGLDQQAMADDVARKAFAPPVEQGAAHGAVGTAIQVMDPHFAQTLPSECGAATKNGALKFSAPHIFGSVCRSD